MSLYSNITRQKRLDDFRGPTVYKASTKSFWEWAVVIAAFAGLIGCCAVDWDGTHAPSPAIHSEYAE